MKLVLVHAFDVRPFTITGDAPSTPDISSLLASSKAELDSLLTTLKRRWPASDALFCRAPACETILEAARECGSDLVVLGTSGRRGLARLLLGSVAEKIVRLSTIPALTVHPAAAANRDPKGA